MTPTCELRFVERLDPSGVVDPAKPPSMVSEQRKIRILQQWWEDTPAGGDANKLLTALILGDPVPEPTGEWRDIPLVKLKES